jgi:hypothetical protein
VRSPGRGRGPPASRLRCARGFVARTLAYALDSLVRVTRRVGRDRPVGVPGVRGGTHLPRVARLPTLLGRRRARVPRSRCGAPSAEADVPLSPRTAATCRTGARGRPPEGTPVRTPNLVRRNGPTSTRGPSECVAGVGHGAAEGPRGPLPPHPPSRRAATERGDRARRSRPLPS